MSRTPMTKLHSFLMAAFVGLSMMSCGGGDDDSKPAAGGLVAPADAKVIYLSAAKALHVSWLDNNTSEHHYSVERKEGTGAFVEVDVPLQNATAYHDEKVDPGKTYTYRIAAVKESLEKGPWSAEVSAAVP